MNFEYIGTKYRSDIILTFRSISTRVQIQFPTQWNEVKCARVRTQNMPASFTPDLAITDNDDNDDDGEGSVWTLQHQECGARGLVVRANWNFFLTSSSDIMNHHKKGNQLTVTHQVFTRCN